MLKRCLMVLYVAALASNGGFAPQPATGALAAPAAQAAGIQDGDVFVPLAMSGGPSVPVLASIKVSVPPGGATVALPGYATVVFPAGALSSTQTVDVSATTSSATAAEFEETAAMFQPTVKPPYEIRINTGAVEPAIDLQVALDVPDALLAAVPAGSAPLIYGQLLSTAGEDALDLFDPVASSFDAATKQLVGAVPNDYFTKLRRDDATFEAIVVPSSTMGPKPRPGTSQANQCQGGQIGPPLKRALEVTSPFDPSREHPITGETKAHTGADFRAVDGDEVIATAEGEVTKVGFSEKQLPSGKTVGAGVNVVITHNDGSRSTYMHLKSGSVTVQKGDVVTQGQQIAQADSTGGVTGPHLHFEYVPGLPSPAAGTRVDPVPCIDTAPKTPKPCNTQTVSGGFGVTTTEHELGKTSGVFGLSWDARRIPDQFEAYYQGALIYTTGGPVSGAGGVSISFGPGSATKVTIIVTGTDQNTIWDYTVDCPTS